MNKPLKTFIASSVRLPKVDSKYRSNNNNCQFTILCRAKSKKEVARILTKSLNEDRVNSFYHHLRTFNGIHEAGDLHRNIPEKDNVIYFQPGMTRTGYYQEWIEYV